MTQKTLIDLPAHHLKILHHEVEAANFYVVRFALAITLLTGHHRV